MVACPYCGHLISSPTDEHECNYELIELDYVTPAGAALTWSGSWWLLDSNGNKVQELGRLDVVEGVKTGYFRTL